VYYVALLDKDDATGTHTESMVQHFCHHLSSKVVASKKLAENSTNLTFSHNLTTRFNAQAA
jgi:hypothetical protein